MILVDSSVWIDHLRLSVLRLQDLLYEGQVIMHPFVAGELAMGNLPGRAAYVSGFGELPHAIVADDEEVMALVERHRLFGRGIGYVDAHLLASARIIPGTLLWTRDVRLNKVANELGVAASAGTRVN